MTATDETTRVAGANSRGPAATYPIPASGATGLLGGRVGRRTVQGHPHHRVARGRRGYLVTPLRLDGLCLRQAWAGNEGLLLNLPRDRSPLAQARLQGFPLNKGPWDRLGRCKTLLASTPPRHEAADFYPVGATRAEIATRLNTSPEADISGLFARQLLIDQGTLGKTRSGTR